MMVDGSHDSTIPPPPHQENNDSQQEQIKKEPITTTAPPIESASAPPAVTPPVVAEETSVVTTGRSRWNKLRHTVQLSSAITQVAKKPPLKREDSFLKRFSTRPVSDPNASEGSARLAGEGMFKSHLFGLFRSVVNPDENILFYWLSLVTICLLYNAWTIIVRQAFPELQNDWSTLWYFLDGFTDIVFILDIAFQFRTGYLEQGLMVCESRKLAGHYMKSKSFIMDIVAILPLDLVQIQFGVFPVIRFPRFFKLYRSFRLYYMVESRTIYPNLWRVVNLIHILLLLAHWFGCFYYLLSEFENFVGEWSYPKPVYDYATLSRKYLGSVYWSTLTLTTIGDLATPATNLQYMFTIISYLIGVFIFATIVGQVGTVITNRNASRLEFERLLDGAKLYMRHHKVPRNMQRRVQRWYDYSWSRGRMQGGGDINSALGILPDKLKTELALHVNLKTLKKVSIFQECQPEFLHDLVLKMRAYIFTPGDLICRKGEVAREMFIIADGILEVISETGKVLTQMKAGDFFGEIGILNLDGFNRRTADVRSVGYSELFSLSREDILAAMKDYPEAQDILQTMGRKRLMEARLAANIGRAGANAADPNLASAGQNGDEKIDPLKPKSAVSKLINKDVLNLKKLLRTRSTASGTTLEPDTIEMKQMQSCDDDGSPSKRRNVSFQKLIKKIQFKREDSSSSVKSLADKLSAFRSKPEKSIVETSSASTEDSGDSSTPLNKSLPLLQRVRLLGAQEKKSELLGSLNVTSKSPPFTTSKLTEFPFEKKESNEKGNKQPSPKFGRFDKTAQLHIPKEDIQPTSPKSKSNPLSSILTSALSIGATSPRSSKKLSPKKESAESKKPPLSPKSSRLPDGSSSEIPLLKKVLLRKVMDDKKQDGQRNLSPTEHQENLENHGTHFVFEDHSTESGDITSEDTSNRVYLEQFSRTLGFQMSEDVTPSLKQPQPRQRLNASSITPSPSKENINPENAMRNGNSENKEENKIISPPPDNRGRLSRMMAVREDSDERSVIGETGENDPFVKSTECQTELFDTTYTKEIEEKRKYAEVDPELSKYLKSMISDLESVIKSYAMEQVRELQKENDVLRKESQEKDSVIKKLLSRLEENSNWETFDEISSLGESSITLSDNKEDNQNDQKIDSDCDDKSASESDTKDLEDNESKLLLEQSKKPRKSWPSSICARRRKLGLTRQSLSLDDPEYQKMVLAEEDELWRVEFPPPPPNMPSRSVIPKPKIYPALPESFLEELPSDLERPSPFERSLTVKSDNDWEVKMLVEQFEENVHHSRRHSSGEALSWDKVLRLRNSIRTKNPPAPAVRGRRKFSLIEDSSGRPLSCPSSAAGASSIMPQSTSYSSLISVDHHRDSAGINNTKTDPKHVRRKSSNIFTQSRPTGRKCSLPIIQPLTSISMARWLSLENVKPEDIQNQESSHRTSISSGYSQETVIEVGSRYSSSEDVHEPDNTEEGHHSSNTATKDTSFSLNLATAPRITDWPSSPCLPTIREDEHSQALSFSTTKSSPGRSFSHDCLSKTFALKEMVQNHRKNISFQQGDSDSFHETFFSTVIPPSNDNVILELNKSTCKDISSDNQRFYGDESAENISSSKLSMKENPKTQNSVVINIPNFEPILSP